MENAKKMLIHVILGCNVSRAQDPPQISPGSPLAYTTIVISHYGSDLSYGPESSLPELAMPDATGWRTAPLFGTVLVDPEENVPTISGGAPAESSPSP